MFRIVEQCEIFVCQARARGERREEIGERREERDNTGGEGWPGWLAGGVT